MDLVKVIRMVIAALGIICAISVATAEDKAHVVAGHAPLQASIDVVLERVTPSVVSLWSGEKRDLVCTATIISPDGLILTCGHVTAQVGEFVEIRLADGRRLDAEVVSKLSSHELDNRRDLALVQLTDKGPWPAVEIGTAADITESDPLISLGFANTGIYGQLNEGPPRQVHLGHRITEGGAPADLIATNIRGCGGDSGGPLFDLGGRLVGTLSANGNYGAQNMYVSVDVLRRGWKELAGDRPVPTLSAEKRPGEATEAEVMAKAVGKVRDAVVEIRSNDRWVGIGVVVGKGLILTKSSELGPNLKVVLRHDIPAYARIAATDLVRDLALLRMSAYDMTDTITPVEWADVKDLPAGTLVAAPTPVDFTPPTGVVSVPARTIPPMGGGLAASVEDAEGGVKVIQVWEELNQLWLRPPTLALEVGDLVTHIGGEPVRNRKGYYERFQGTAGGPPRLIMGDKVKVTFQRDGKTNEVTTRLTPAYTIGTQLIWPYSYRHTGFPSAMACDFNARPEFGGAPVVDVEGRVVGVFVARAPFVESFVIPASEVKTSLAEMIQSSSMIPYSQLDQGPDAN